MSTRNAFLHDLHDILLAIRRRQPIVELRCRNFSEERRRACCDEHGAIVDASIARDSHKASVAMRARLMARSRGLFGEKEGKAYERPRPACQTVFCRL
jgi:DNA-binding GntR family transcriptional regulator